MKNGFKSYLDQFGLLHYSCMERLGDKVNKLDQVLQTEYWDEQRLYDQTWWVKWSDASG